MTEAEWKFCTDPKAMLLFLRESNNATQRKLRLFVSALLGLAERPEARRLGAEALADFERYQTVAERYADGGIVHPELAPSLERMFAKSVAALSDAENVAGSLAHTGVAPEVMCQTARCVFGNPFRPVPTLSTAWLAPNVVQLAENIYQRKSFDRLPELADALEAAGCTDAEVLGHLRSPGPHVRGCHVLDLVLGKA